MSAFLRATGVPLAIFFLHRLLLWVATLVVPFPYWDPHTWAHWDSGHYESIAGAGYGVWPCLPPDDPARLCGNTAWLPLYPAAINLVTAPAGSTDYVAAGVLISAVAEALFLIVAWRLFAGGTPFWMRAACLAALATFPGNIYFAAMFPNSLVLLLLILLVAASERRQSWPAGVTAFFISLSYSTGFVAPVVLAAHTLLTSASRKFAYARVAALALAVAAAIAVFFTILQIQAGSWIYYFQVQSNYGNGIYNPVLVLRDRLITGFPLLPLSFGSLVNFSGGVRLDAASFLQSLLVVVECALVAWNVFVQNRAVSNRERLLALLGLAFWIGPLTVGPGVSIWRSDTLVAPIALLFPRLGYRAVLPLLVCHVLLSIPMALLYFENQLI